MRYKLFKGNRITKYFLYAFGEIFLIVVGILIAVQISNWNEKQKAKSLGDEMISEIKGGLGSDLIELDKFISSQRQVFKSQMIVSNWLSSKNSYTDSLSIHLSRTYVAKDFSINYSGYETLKKFGLKRIENDSLRASISNLYEIKYPTFIKFSTIYQDFLDNLLAINPKHFNELNYMRSTIHPIEPENLKKDAEFTYHFNTLKNFNQLLIFQGMILKKEMEKTYSSME